MRRRQRLGRCYLELARAAFGVELEGFFLGNARIGLIGGRQGVFLMLQEALVAPLALQSARSV
jgi:hypothetical protein